MARAKDIHWKGRVVKGFTTALTDAGEHLTGWAKEWMSEAVRESILQMDSVWPHTTIIENTIRRSRKPNSTKYILVGAQMFGGDRTHPWYSGQLHDSVVGVVSDRRRIVSVSYMPSRADFPQKDDNGSPVNGSELALNSISALSRVTRFLPGVSASVYITVPYAEKVNEMPRHLNYMEEIAADFAGCVEDFFYERAEGYKTRIYRTK